MFDCLVAVYAGSLVCAASGAVLYALSPAFRRALLGDARPS